MITNPNGASHIEIFDDIVKYYAYFSGIYLISSNPSDPEMFELKVQKPKDKQLWIQAIRAAVETCPQDLENDTDDPIGNNGENEQRDHRSSSLSTISAEERQRIVDAKQSHIRDIVDELRKKDAQQATLLEEKMGLQLRLRSATGVWNTNESDNERESREDKELPDYSRLVPDYKRLVHADIGLVWSEVSRTAVSNQLQTISVRRH